MSERQEHLWCTRRDGCVRGPFPQAQISQNILLGRIREDDELSLDRETWQRLRDLPQLIPEVMKNVHTEADQQRLQEARIRADERRHADRRLGSERMRGNAVGERRQGRDRRKPETTASLQHREARRWSRPVDADADNDSVPFARRYRWALLTGVVLLLLFSVFTPDKRTTHPDCNAPAAPQVNWDNCRMPGLVAEQANLRGAQARNMDLNGARLTGATLIGSDLAYTQLNAADLRRADLSNARLTGAALRNADLRGARLAGADLSYADLRDANLDGVVLNETRFDNAIWTDGRTCQTGSVGRCM